MKTIYQFPSGVVVVLPAVLTVEHVGYEISSWHARMNIKLRMIGAPEPFSFTAFCIDFPGSEPDNRPKVKKARQRLVEKVEHEKQKFLTALEASPR